MDRSEFQRLREEGQLLSSVQLAEELGVKTATLRRWCKELRIPPVLQARENYYDTEQAALLRKYGKGNTHTRRQMERDARGRMYVPRVRGLIKKRSRKMETPTKFNTTLLIGMVAFIVALLVLLIPHSMERGDAKTALEVAKSWPVVFSDMFDSNENDWLVGIDEFNPDVKRLIIDDRYYWEVNSDEGSVSLVLISDESFKDFYLSIHAGLVNTWENWDCEFGAILRLTEGGTHYGVTHREIIDSPRHDSHYYGSIKFNRILEDGGEILSNKFTRNSKIYPGPPAIRHQPEGMAQIEIIALGEKFFIFLDGIFSDAVEDDNLYEGYLGLMVTWPGKVSDFVVAFDNLVIRAP